MSAPHTEGPIDEVLFELRHCSDNNRMGIVTLNTPGSLNALTLNMIRRITLQLQEWRQDDAVVCVVLRGAGDKAFCAGGDIVQLYKSVVAAEGGPAPYAENFFTEEYRLDFLIHNYPKPLICCGHGIVMGGGMGLMVGCSHRIVTEATRMAMPEISIGLFPDVGGTWFLSRMDPGIGLFLGLTGAQCNAADALQTGWADAFLPAGQLESFLQALQRLPWSSAESNHSRITQVLRSWQEQHQAQLPSGNLEQHQPLIQAATHFPSVAAVASAILALPAPDRWWEKAQKNLENGCPVTAHLVWWQVTQGRSLSLAGVFRKELILAVNCTRYPDFREGVRALLIDKDNRPDWSLKNLADVTPDLMEAFHLPPWTEHPLADLGN
jgi:enoyl-CoA hydratase/carnithine racemase